MFPGYQDLFDFITHPDVIWNQNIKGVISMCDTNKYHQMYQEIKTLNPDETLQLIMESESKEEQDFFGVIGDFLLQQKQKELINRNVF